MRPVARQPHESVATPGVQSETQPSDPAPPFRPGDFVIAVSARRSQSEGVIEVPAPLVPSGNGDKVMWHWHVSPGHPFEFVPVSLYRRATVEEMFAEMKANDLKILELMGKSHRLHEEVKRQEFIASKGASDA